MKLSISIDDSAPFVQPTISLNGTGEETLKKEYKKAIDKLNEAINAFKDVTVHGRDYNETRDYYKAADDKFRMTCLLEIVELYLKSIYMPIKYRNKDLDDYCAKEIERYVKLYNESK